MISPQKFGCMQTVTGFNVGIIAGALANQTVFHVHLHVIPRRDGDVVDPRKD